MRALLGASPPIPAGSKPGSRLLCDAEIIEEVAGARPDRVAAYRFTQTLLQDVIYQNLLLQRRTEMHGRIGAALEQLCGDEPERLEDLTLLGHHFSLSAAAREGRALSDGGRRSARARSTPMTMRSASTSRRSRALPRHGRSPTLAGSAQRADRRSLRAGRAARLGATSTTRTALEPIAPPATAVGAARILRKIGRLLWDAGKRERPRPATPRPPALLEGADAPVERAHLAQERGRLAFRIGDHASAVAMGR